MYVFSSGEDKFVVNIVSDSLPGRLFDFLRDVR